MSDIKTITVNGTQYDIKDATAREDCSDLKSAIEEITVSNGQLINPATIGIFTGYINGSGVFKASSSYRTLYYPCKPNTAYVATENDKTLQRAVALSDAVPVENGTSTYAGIISAINPLIKFNTQSYSYICITFYNRNSGDSSVESALANIKLQEGSQYTEGYEYGGVVPLITYGGLDSIMLAKDALLTDTAEKVDAIYSSVDSGKNVVDLSTSIEGYYVSMSGLQANASHKCLDYAEIKPNTNYIVSQEGGNASMITCVFYDENFMALSYYSPFSSAESPATAKYIRCSCAISTTKLSVVEGTAALDLPYWNKINEDILKPHGKPRVLRNYAATMAANDTLSISIPDIKKNGVYALHMNVTSMGEFSFGPGRTKNNRSAYVVVDDTNITIKYYTSSAQTWRTYAHGLTIANELDLCVVQSDTEYQYASIRISSSGSSYKTPELQFWKGNDTPLSLDIMSGSYTDIEMTFYCKDYTKDLYIFGDSYLDHWPRYVVNATQNNYRNFLLDGYGGRGSASAISSLRLIAGSGGIPRKIFWCLGMNDGDSGEINTTWLNCFNILVDFCNQYNIELILCTIPNVPSVDNTYKNSFIRSSGYRYVDLAAAVGSDISTSWFSGLLSNDNVHPSTAGDKMIADYMITQVPEMI